jgi:serine/threonine-protein kinase RsbW
MDLMAEQQTVEITIPCLSEYVGVVRLAISGLATRMNFSVEDVEDIKIAVSEACTNCVQYAYPENRPGNIQIRCKVSDDHLEISVTDTGKGFDVNQPIPSRLDAPEPERLGLGLGLTFIKSLTDFSEVTSNLGQGTTVKMVKKVSISDPK